MSGRVVDMGALTPGEVAVAVAQWKASGRPSAADSRRDWVKGVLDDALVIVAERGVPADLAPVALAKAIDLLASAEG